MKQKPEIIDESGEKYKYGFTTDIDVESVPKGLSEDIIRLISAKKLTRRFLSSAKAPT